MFPILHISPATLSNRGNCSVEEEDEEGNEKEKEPELDREMKVTKLHVSP